jgi:hypothetical protein
MKFKKEKKRQKTILWVVVIAYIISQRYIRVRLSLHGTRQNWSKGIRGKDISKNVT